MMEDRLPHAILDQTSRTYKAQKIAAALGAERLAACGQLLEVGTGSGLIAQFFRHRLPHCHVSSTDVVDNRVITEGVDFHLVRDTRLPFADSSFNVVITNHVIEHVGSQAAQTDHLREIERVLKPGGVVYFAVPNRWALMENHYHLPFLSWPVKRLRDAYMHATGKGTHYDCEPLSYNDIRRLVRSATTLSLEDITLRGIGLALSLERPRTLLDTLYNRAGLGVLAVLLMPLVPTYILLLHKEQRA